MTQVDSEVQQVWRSFWQEIVTKDGQLDIEQVKKELSDYHMMLGFVPRVYMHVTGGRVSKPNTDPGAVINLADDVVNELIREALKEEREGRPKIVCICGSSRFVDIVAVMKWEEEKKGNIAIGMHLLPSWYPGVRPDHQAEKEGVAQVLDELHLRKIDLADEVLVVNHDGYIGERTAVEIAYAKEQGKPIRYTNPIEGV